MHFYSLIFILSTLYMQANLKQAFLFKILG